jgi:hypothetical protein
MANETKRVQLTKEHREAMAAVRNGADVYSYATALRLREVERAYPDLVDIGPAMNPPPNGADQQPYFGAILTAAGKDALAKATGGL